MGDHSLLCDALRALLMAQDAISVVGQTGTCEDALRLPAGLRPDVILLDVTALENPGRAVRELLTVPGRAPVIAMARQDRVRVVREVLAAGAACYLPQNTRGDQLIRTVRAVHRGGGRSAGLDPAGRPDPSPDASTTQLTERERQVLELVARARSNRQIGAQLRITEGTVKRHLRNIFGKLGAISRIDAVNKALAAGLIHPTVIGPRAAAPPVRAVRPDTPRFRPVRWS